MADIGTDPNYYRLGYQLSAQLLNSEHASEGQGDFKVLDVLFGGVDRGVRPAASKPAGARIVAERFRKVAIATMTRYDTQKRSAGRWRFWRRLEPSEERLRRFLCCTVIPCLELVIAGSLRAEGKAESA